MFTGCSNITSFEGFSKEKIPVGIKASEMLQSCSNLVSADLMSLSFENNIGVDYMFANCSELTTIFYDKEIVSSNSASMIAECKKLTNYSASYPHDATFAYPNNGLTGFLTDPHPTITLTPFEGGHYEDAGGSTITSIEGD